VFLYILSVETNVRECIIYVLFIKKKLKKILKYFKILFLVFFFSLKKIGYLERDRNVMIEEREE